MAVKLTETTRRTDMFFVDPRDIIVGHEGNGRFKPPTDEQILERAQSMLDVGQLQPILIYKKDEEIHVSAGFTRTLAGKLIVEKLKPAAIGEGFMLQCKLTECNSEEAFIRNVAENLERNNTTPMDDAKNQRRLREEMGWSDERIANFYHLSSSYVHYLRKLLTLNSVIQDKVHDGIIGVSHAIGLAELSEAEQKQALKAAIEPIDEKKQHKKATEPGDINISGAKLNLVVRKKRAAKGAKVGRTLREVKRFFEGMTGPGEENRVKEIAENVLKFIGNLNFSEEEMGKVLRGEVTCV